MKAKIFIVSQDIDVVKIIGDTLEGEGHKVTSSDIPGTVVLKCKEENFDLAFVDVYIRGVPYDKLIADIKKVHSDTEVILITTYAFPESMTKGETLDIAGYLIKPLTEDKIKNVTNRALRHGELARENRRLLLAVTAAKKEWEATVDAIEDPLFVTDFDYNILRANLATFRELGKGVNEVVGKKCYEVFHCAKHALDDCPGKRARDSGEPSSETLSFKGLRRRFNCSVYPQVFAAGGGLVHYLREPPVDIGQQAEALTKYERLFDDASIPVLFVNSAEYRVVDANQKAIELFGYAPEELSDIDLENLFTQSSGESAFNNITNQVEKKEGPLKTKILTHDKKEKDVFIIANAIEIGGDSFIELFIAPADLFIRPEKTKKGK